MSIKFKYLLTIILISLLAPKLTFAFGFSDLFTLLDHLSESTEEAFNTFWDRYIFFILLYLFSFFSFLLSSHYLQVVINHQIAWLIKLSPVTQLGWGFTAGLANMFLILIFVIIAFAIILKIETFQAKKALFTLIIVALLLNFSSSFVGMLVDLTQIVYSTILKAAGENFVWTVIKPFIGSNVAALFSIIARLIAETGLLAVPLLHQFFQISYTVGFPLFLPNIITWGLQSFYFFSLTVLFAAFIFLFGARVVIIHILTVLSPLAFLCLILPQTKKWGEFWLKTLLEWLILGIVFLFFIVLGFKGLGYLKAEDPIGSFLEYLSFLPIFNWVSFFKNFFYYFVMFIYMAVILGIGWKIKPAAADGLIKFATSATTFVWSRGLKPFSRKVVEETQSELYKRKKIEEKRRAEAEARGQKIPPSRFEPFWHMAYRWAERGLKTRVSEREKKLGVLSDEELRYLASREIVDATTTAAINILAKRGKLTEEIKDRLEKAIPYGLSVGEVLKRRPDWADIFGKKVEDVIREMTPREFVKNVQEEALKTKDVFRAMTIKQLREIEKSGSRGQKLAVGEIFWRHSSDWDVEIGENWQKGERGDLKAKLKGDELARKKLIIESNDEFVGP